MKEKILFLVENPLWISAIVNATNLLLDVDSNSEKFALYKKSISEKETTSDNINYSYFNYDIDWMTIKKYRKTTNNFIKTFKFAFNKTIAFITKKITKYSWLEVHIFRKKAKKLIKKHHISQVISISNSSKTRVRVLFGLEKYCKTKCFWFELPDNNKQKFFNDINKHITMNYVRAVDVDFFKSKINKIHVLEFPTFLNGFSPICDNNNKKTLGYFGAFHKNIREPNVILKLMELLPDYKLVIYTDINSFYKLIKERNYYVGNNVVIIDEIPFCKLPNVLNDVNILVNIENINTQFKPSKTGFYVSTKKPIFSIGKIEDPIAEIARNKYKSFMEIPNDINCLNDNISNIKNYFENVKITSEEDIKKQFGEYTTEHIFNELIK